MKTKSNIVHERLFQRFYTNGKRNIDLSASSHWKEFSKNFSVAQGNNDKFTFKGYGFGGQASGGVISRIFTVIGNILQLVSLNDRGLRKDLRAAKKIVRKMGLSFSQDAFRQVCTVNLLKKHFTERDKIYNFFVIGDGPGILSAILHVCFPNARIILADLGSVLFFQSIQLNKAFPEFVQRISDEDSPSEVGFIFYPADSLNSIPDGDFDLAINVASMQEFDPSITKKYFELLRKKNTSMFYCCNRLEKRLIGGEITRFMDYPWKTADKHLVDELCPWHQWFLGVDSTSNVKFLGLPIPFMHKYDGPHWHRLTQLSR